jgi:predicted  nucleic acid-binding Zn-ribbon protein
MAQFFSKTQRERLKAQYNDLSRLKQDATAANERLRIKLAKIDQQMQDVDSELIQLWDTNGSES